MKKKEYKIPRNRCHNCLVAEGYENCTEEKCECSCHKRGRIKGFLDWSILPLKERFIYATQVLQGKKMKFNKKYNL
jgi:hypothetical protein